MINKSSEFIQNELSQITHELVDQDLRKSIKTGIVHRLDVLKLSIETDDIEKAKLNLVIIDHNTIKLTVGCNGDGKYAPMYTSKYALCREDHKK